MDRPSAPFRLATAGATLVALVVAGAVQAGLAAVLLAWTTGTPAALTLARAVGPRDDLDWLQRVRRGSGAVGWAMGTPVLGTLAAAWAGHHGATLPTPAGSANELAILLFCGVPAIAALAVGIGAALSSGIAQARATLRDGSGLAPHHR